MEKLKALKHIPPDNRSVALNNDTGMLKLLACLLMLSDHMGKMIFPNAFVLSATGALSFLVPKINIMRAFGRLAMPMFAYCIAVGCAKTRNIWKYALRLFVMAVLVHPLYQAAMGHVAIGAYDWARGFYKLGAIYEHYYSSNLNILFTLTLGTLIIGCFRARAYAPMALCVLLTWIMASRIDYGYKGVVLIVLFYAFLDRPLASFVSVFLFMWYWAMPNFFTSGSTHTGSQIYAILSLAFIYLPVKKRRVRLPKWFFYGFYPAHLLLIYVLQII